MYKTEGLIETHFHGAFGVDFMNCSADDIVEVAIKIANYGITRIYPTLMTGDIAQIKKQIAAVKKAQEIQPKNSALIGGVHLEGPFINSYKKGIHQEEYILEPKISEFKKLEDDIIKIVTLAPENDDDRALCKYLRSKGILVQAGHTMTYDLSECNAITHMFNAMAPLSHKVQNIISSALINDNIFIEIIADGNHVIDDVLKMVFRLKKHNKIMLISDALPQTKSGVESFTFAGQEVAFKNGSFYNANGTLAGSGMLQCDILKRLVQSNLLSFYEAAYMMNVTQLNYLKVFNNAYVTFDDDLNPVETKFTH